MIDETYTFDTLVVGVHQGGCDLFPDVPDLLLELNEFWYTGGLVVIVLAVLCGGVVNRCRIEAFTQADAPSANARTSAADSDDSFNAGAAPGPSGKWRAGPK